MSYSNQIERKNSLHPSVDFGDSNKAVQKYRPMG
jgi:hypothetical protein